MSDYPAPTLHDLTKAFLLKAGKRPQEDRELITEALFTAVRYRPFRRQEAAVWAPVSAALLLLTLEADTETVIAGLLADSLQEGHVTGSELRAQFGADIAQLTEAAIHQKMFSRKEFQEKLLAKAQAAPQVAWIALACRVSFLQQGTPISTDQELDLREFYLAQLCRIPTVPKELVKALASSIQLT